MNLYPHTQMTITQIKGEHKVYSRQIITVTVTTEMESIASAKLAPS